MYVEGPHHPPLMHTVKTSLSGMFELGGSHQGAHHAATSSACTSTGSSVISAYCSWACHLHTSSSSTLVVATLFWGMGRSTHLANFFG